MSTKHIPETFRKAVEELLDDGKNSQAVFRTLQDCLNDTQHPNNNHNAKQNLLRTGKTLRKNRSIARALTENGGKNNILKKTKLNIELLNDQLLELQTQQGKNFSLEDTAKFSRVIRALSEAAVFGERSCDRAVFSECFSCSQKVLFCVVIVVGVLCVVEAVL